MDRQPIALILTLLSALTIGCSRVDLEAERQAVLAADRAFAQASLTGSLKDWVEAFAEDGTMYPQRGKATGHDEIRRAMAPQFKVQGLELTWEPATAVVAAAADYAYTLGTWTLKNTSPLSPIGVGGTGNYVMIWRKEDNGGWKVMVNIGNADLPPDMREGRRQKSAR